MNVYKRTEVTDLLGKTLTKIDVGEYEILFETSEGIEYLMEHDQDCCEHVYLEDVCGDIQDLIGSPVLQAEEVTQQDENPPEVEEPKYQDSFTWTFYKLQDSFTWTFYKLATIKGSVTLRWYGESNGYYSEKVDFKKVVED